MLLNQEILNNSYKILEEIGSGGGGVIYKAYHIRLEKYVVLKKIKDNVKGKIDIRGEADILKKLHHTYLPQVYDFIVIDEDVYTVIDYIEGQSFDKLLKEKKTFSQKQIIKWTRQLCEALEYLHSQNPPIIHSDIKPANIMLKTNDDICLIDFNISLLIDGYTNPIGKSDGYSPPEQYVVSSNKHTELQYSNENTESLLSHDHTEVLEVETELLKVDPTSGINKIESSNSSRHYYKQTHASIDERSDIYSLGATIYHMITGIRPSISTDKTKPMDELGFEVSDGLKYIIEKSVKLDPNERFQSSKEMLKAVVNIHKLDGRYKLYYLKQWIIAGLIVFLFTLSFVTTALGYRVMGIEKNEKYDFLISSANDLIYEKKYDEAMNIASDAYFLLPNRIESVHVTALGLFKKGNYEECIQYLSKNINNNFESENKSEVTKKGDLYFILANCFFELEDYKQGVIFYEDAISHNDNNSQYFRDYAISLMRLDRVKESEEALEEAILKGLDTPDVMLVKGEISLAQKNFEEAEKSFLEVIAKANDNYIKERAVISCAKMYKNLEGSIKKEINLLDMAVEELNMKDNYAIMEMLGDAYSRYAQMTGEKEHYLKAIRSFEELLNKGYSSFHINNNIAILYQNINEYAKAEEILTSMKEEFKENYKVYMQLAFLHAEIENTKENRNRNYKKVYDNYKSAKSLYEERQNKNATDLQMNMLEDLIDEIRSGGWLD